MPVRPKDCPARTSRTKYEALTLDEAVAPYESMLNADDAELDNTEDDHSLL